MDSFPAEPQGKPKNTGVGSLSLLQEIYPTQESNQGLLHCRWILYQLSYQGSHQSLKDLEQLCSLRAKITKQSLTERVWVLGPPETLRDKEGTSGTSLAVQGLRLHASSASTAGIAGSIPALRTKIPYTKKRRIRRLGFQSWVTTDQQNGPVL